MVLFGVSLLRAPISKQTGQSHDCDEVGQDEVNDMLLLVFLPKKGYAFKHVGQLHDYRGLK